MREFHFHTGQGRIFGALWEAPGAGGGDGVPIVLLHDSLGAVALWRDFPQGLARATGRTVVAYDRLGFGRSDPHPGDLPPDFIRAEARGTFQALRGHLGLRDFILFGHSVGGGMAVACAAAHPGACRALVTESAQAFVEPRTLEGIRRAQAGFAGPGQMERLARYHGEKAPWVLGAWVHTWQSEAFRGWCLDPELACVRAPLLALHGDGDEYGSLEQPGRIAALSGGRLEILAGCGHVPHRERPREVLEAVGAFLAGCG